MCEMDHDSVGYKYNSAEISPWHQGSSKDAESSSKGRSQRSSVMQSSFALFSELFLLFWIHSLGGKSPSSQIDVGKSLVSVTRT